MTISPIPKNALDDRLAFIGTSGSGKTFAAKGRVEELLRLGHRVVIIDPLDVWWGLRADLTGKKAAFDVAILGGKHADMQITELSGALIGEAVAKSKDSCIVSLGSLKTQAKRQRFMLAFLDALYENTDTETIDPYHVIFDEADLWAPQKPMGQEAMLCHLMEEIVRRGRVKGFIPWFITQRPAVLNKNVLSQADGMIALQLTSSQDRKAIRAWVESTADEGQWAQLDKALPSFAQGQGVVWIPSLGMLQKVTFPPNATFDSSRTPKRGERKSAATLKPLNIEALRAKLATVEKETKENDPAALKMLVMQLRAELAKKPVPVQIAQGPSLDKLAETLARGREEGFLVGHHVGAGLASVVGKYIADAIKSIEDQLLGQLSDGVKLAEAQEFTQEQAGFEGVGGEAVLRKLRKGGAAPVKAIAPLPKDTLRPVQIGAGGRPPPSARPEPRTALPGIQDASISRPQQHLLNTLAWWESIGRQSADKDMLAFLARVSSTSSSYTNNLGALRTAGFIDYPQPGQAALTAEGRARAVPPTAILDSAALQDQIKSRLSRPQIAIIDALLDGRQRTKEGLAEEVSASAGSSSYTNNLGCLRSLGFITYPQPGQVAISPTMFI